MPLKSFDINKFPVPLDHFKPVPLSLKETKLTEEHKKNLQANIKLLRDAIVFFTASGAARGVSGHTGGPYDTVPEVVILLALFAGPDGNKFVQTMFDEAGHRAATQYILCVLDGAFPADHLLNYREAGSHLPGHPELGVTPGAKFSSGRLGHMFAMINGVSEANQDKMTILLGSDGSQQEGDDAEAARFAVAKNLNVKVFIDYNNVTISGHPSDYLPGFDVGRTLEGHGMKVLHANGEDLDSLYTAMLEAFNSKGPVAVITKRPMAPGIKGIEGVPGGHDVIPLPTAIEYLKDRGYDDAIKVLEGIKPRKDTYVYEGSTKDRGACRVAFGEAVADVLDKTSQEENKEKVLCIDSDLEGSTGLKVIHQRHPEVFVTSGVCERNNFSVAAGFGSFLPEGTYRTGIFSTFSAFLEMVISELTMARLNHSNVLSHFSHSGVDEMADNTCHFGLNNLFADNGLDEAGVPTALYFPADPTQMHAVVEKALYDPGLRFVFSTRSKVPWVLKEGSDTERFYGEGYKFVPGKDDIIRGTPGKVDGWIVSFGEMLYRCVDAVERLKKEGIHIGLVNKATLNMVDEEAIKVWGSGKVLLVAESFNQNTGLGSKVGSWLLKRGLTPGKYDHVGTTTEGSGGLWEQILYQGLGPESLVKKIKEMLA
uniref:Transketolase n=1 Tax=Moniliella megachiliensis TaxID=203381 RepID=A0A1L7NSY2_9BASI|nr:transketolase [Moniliella megachiliensis]